jgi:hypothetical protein
LRQPAARAAGCRRSARSDRRCTGRRCRHGDESGCGRTMRYRHLARTVLVPIDTAGMGCFDVHAFGVHYIGRSWVVVENAVHPIAIVRVRYCYPLGVVEHSPIVSKIVAHRGIEIPACWELRRRSNCRNRIRRRRRSRHWGWANRYWIRHWSRRWPDTLRQSRTSRLLKKSIHESARV